MGYNPSVVAACLLLALTLVAAEVQNKPNIIMFIGDDVGTADHQLYDRFMHTPHLLELAKLGVTMNQSYTLQACTPTRTALLTGKYPFKIGMHIGKIKGTNLRWTPLGHKLIPATLKELGYKTHAIGKWHLGYCHWDLTPRKRGFDHFYGFFSGAQGYFTHSKEDGSSFDFRDDDEVAWHNNGSYATELHVARLKKIINKQKPDSPQPFFVYMAFQNAHAPWEAKQRYIDDYCSHVNDKKRKIHCAMVAAMDEGIGEIMKSLEKRGLSNNTILIYLTDNGGPLGYGSYNWPLRGGKASFWEGGMRSHTVFVWPKKMASNVVGTTYSGLFHVTDWYPTLVKAAGGDPEALKSQGIDGMDQLDNLLQGLPAKRTRMIYSIDETKNRTALRIGDMKLMTGYPASTSKNSGWWAPPDLAIADKIKTIQVKKGTIPYNKLYNVREDPGEHDNLYGKPEYAEIQAELEQWLKEEQPKLVPFPKTLKKNLMGMSKYYSGAVSPGWCCPNCA